jgi:hypothetical protein
LRSALCDTARPAPLAQHCSTLRGPDGRRSLAIRSRTVEVRLLHGPAFGPVFGWLSMTCNGAHSLSRTMPQTHHLPMHVLTAVCCVLRPRSPQPQPQLSRSTAASHGGRRRRVVTTVVYEVNRQHSCAVDRWQHGTGVRRFRNCVWSSLRPPHPSTC